MYTHIYIYTIYIHIHIYKYLYTYQRRFCKNDGTPCVLVVKNPSQNDPIISGESDVRACPLPQLNHHNSWVHQDIYSMYIYIFKINIMIEIMVKTRVFYIIRIHDKIYPPPEVFSQLFFAT